MKTLFFSSKPFEKKNFENLKGKHHFDFLTDKLNTENISLINGQESICIFTTDDASAEVLDLLFTKGVKYILLRSAGHDHIDIIRCIELGIKVAYVPAYSPYAVAEHSIALMLALNRKLIIANNQFKKKDFRLDNLIGFDMHKKIVGLVGTGKIGSVAASILNGFGCKILATDLVKSELPFVENVDLDIILKNADIISLYLPSTPETKYLINKKTISQMKKGVMIINISRGILIDTLALIEGLEDGRIGYAGLDVYEHEKNLYFEDHSNDTNNDPILEKLKTFDNVLLTGHQAFLTEDALNNITMLTIENINFFESGIKGNSELC